MRVIKKIIGKLAELTPNTVYFSNSFRVRVNDSTEKLTVKRGGNFTSLGVASTSICCAASQEMRLNEGDTAEITICGVTEGGNEIGDYIVTVRKIK